MHFISRTTEQQEISSNFAKGMNEGGYCQCPVSALPRHKIKLCAYFDDSNDREVSTSPASIHHTHCSVTRCGRGLFQHIFPLTFLIRTLQLCCDRPAADGAPLLFLDSRAADSSSESSYLSFIPPKGRPCPCPGARKSSAAVDGRSCTRRSFLVPGCVRAHHEGRLGGGGRLAR